MVNLTDPQARLMVEGSGSGSVQGYNSQIVCSDDHPVIGVHVSQDANDLNCWAPALAAATTHIDALGKTIGLALADNGYFTETNLTSPGPARLIAPGKGRKIHRDTQTQPTHRPPLRTCPPKTRCGTHCAILNRHNATNVDQPLSNPSSDTLKTASGCAATQDAGSPP